MVTVILAGGSSRRMGRDKAMLPYEGTTLLQYLINKYRTLGSVMVSVNYAGKYAFEGAIEIVDRYPDCGPLNGLVSVFDYTDEDSVFLTAVDLPYGDPTLAKQMELLRGEADICALRRGKKGVEPLFAVYSRLCGIAAEKCLESGKKSVFQIMEQFNVRYIDPEEVAEFDLEHIMTNVNTPEEFQKLGISI